MSLKCERLSLQSDAIIKKLDENYFYNTKNDGIALTLRNEACSEDEQNKKAYYVIKDADDDILFFFSLKCGLLYDRFIDARFLDYLKEMARYLESFSHDVDATPDELQTIDEIKEKIRTTKGLTKADIERIPKKGNTAFDDLQQEFNDRITHVGETFSGIELVHFCSNSFMADKIRSLNLGKRIGVVVFWQFIVDRVLEIMKHIGCEYLFLFAADKSEDEELVSYYRSQLEFQDAVDRSTAKPVYDFTCKFMYQQITDIASRQTAFFQNYNLSQDDV